MIFVEALTIFVAAQVNVTHTTSNLRLMSATFPSPLPGNLPGLRAHNTVTLRTINNWEVGLSCVKT